LELLLKRQAIVDGELPTVYLSLMIGKKMQRHLYADDDVIALEF
jgi:hypothetical protein